jgi:1-acyl-sn-glycerol-3-phosphate acyltransferase
MDAMKRQIIVGKFIINLSYYFWMPYFKIFCQGKITGYNNIPKSGCIFVFNHVSYLDWILCHFIFKKHYNKKLYFIGKADLLKHWLFKHYLIGSETIIIDSSKESTIKMFKKANEYLRQGDAIGIFPEGTRSHDGKIQKAKDGVGFILLKMNVPVVPVGLIGFYDAWSRHKRLPKIAKCSVNIGRSINFNVADYTENKYPVSHLTESIMIEVAKLTGEK